MTAKEKAQELVLKYLNLEPPKMDDHSRIYIPTAKRCALVVADEVIAYSKAHGFIGLTEYWEEIKQEIENI